MDYNNYINSKILDSSKIVKDPDIVLFVKVLALIMSNGLKPKIEEIFKLMDTPTLVRFVYCLSDKEEYQTMFKSEQDKTYWCEMLIIVVTTISMILDNPAHADDMQSFTETFVSFCFCVYAQRLDPKRVKVLYDKFDFGADPDTVFYEFKN